MGTLWAGVKVVVAVFTYVSFPGDENGMFGWCEIWIKDIENGK